MCGWLLSFLFSHLLWRKHLWILHLAIILHLIIASLNLYQNISTEVFPDFLKHIFKYSFQKHIMAKLISFQNFSTSTQNLSWSYFMVSPTMFSLPSYLSWDFITLYYTCLHCLPPLLNHGTICLDIPRAQYNDGHMLDLRLDSDIQQEHRLGFYILNLSSIWSTLDTMYISSANLNTLCYKCLITFQVFVL